MQLVTHSLKAGYNYICQPMSYSTEPEHVGVSEFVNLTLIFLRLVDKINNWDLQVY